MQANKQLDPNIQNEMAYDDLMVSVEASTGVLSLLFAVCDDPQLSQHIIQRYEAELQSQIRPYQVELPRKDPSLRQAIAQVIEKDPYLQAGEKAVLTVTGIERLSRFSSDGEPSEQDRFLGYLQWTREGFRAFPFPIILWLPNQLFVRLSQKAPDFWSWRKDVFYFVCKDQELQSGLLGFDDLGFDDIVVPRTALQPLQLDMTYDAEAMPLEELQNLIQRTEKSLGNNKSDPLLANLYERMGLIYAGQIEQPKKLEYDIELGNAMAAFQKGYEIELDNAIAAFQEGYDVELDNAIAAFQKAAKIQKALNLETNLASSLTWLGYLYTAKDDYKKAEEFYQSALTIQQSQGKENDPSVSNTLNHLSQLYDVQGRNEEAESFAQQLLTISKKSLSENNLKTYQAKDDKTQINSSSSIPWVNIIGSPVTALPFNSQIELMLKWASERKSSYVCVANAHMLVEAESEPTFRSVLQRADLVTPDAMPLVWMLRLLGVRNQDRVAGMDIFFEICKIAQEKELSVFFLGSVPEILSDIKQFLTFDFPKLIIAGMEPFPFRPMALEEDIAVTQKINSSGANIVFVSLGCPKQEYWMAQHKGQINSVMIGLGGVFPVYARTVRRSPEWVKESGLEWLYRLIQEPNRLWKKYSTTIPLFVWLAVKQLLLDRETAFNHSKTSGSKVSNHT